MDSSAEGPTVSRKDKLQKRVTLERRAFLGGLAGLGIAAIAAKLGFSGSGNQNKSAENLQPTNTPTPILSKEENIQDSPNLVHKEVGEAKNNNLEPAPIEPALPADRSGPTSTPVEPAPPVITPTPELTDPEELLRKQKLQEIASSPLGSDARLELERDYCKNAKTLEDIDQGLEWVNNEILRGNLIYKRWKIREEGDGVRLKKLTEAQIEWCLRHNMFPETLAGCLDAQEKTEQILTTILNDQKSEFRPDLVHKVEIGDLPKAVVDNLTASQILINPGGLAELICTETTGTGASLNYKGKDYYLRVGLTKIGNKPAMYNIDSSVFPDSPDALREIAGDIQKESGIVVSADNLPGSVPFEGHKYGGAITSQLMAEHIINMQNDFYRKYPEINSEVSYNPYDYQMCFINPSIFLAQGHKLASGYQDEKEVYVYRYGYLKGNFPYIDDKGVTQDKGEDIRQASIKKWGNDSKQATQVISAANSYYDEVVVIQN